MKNSIGDILILFLVIIVSKLGFGSRDSRNDKFLRLESDDLKGQNALSIYTSPIHRNETRFRALIDIKQLPVIINATRNITKRHQDETALIALGRKHHHDDDSDDSGEFNVNKKCMLNKGASFNAGIFHSFP